MKLSRADTALLDRVRAICLALPESKEEEKWGHPVFVAGKKMFAAFGSHEDNAVVGFKVPDDEFEEMVAGGRFVPAPYAARFNWVNLKLDKATDWAELETLLVGSFRLVALKRMLRELEGA